MPELTPEEKKARAMRAAEVLNSSSWAFDELVAQEQGAWLGAATVEKREEHHRNATAAIALKAHLMAIVSAQQGQEKIDERREQRAARDEA
jgi:hypothetical protein